MITPGEITRRAERKYRDVLRAWLAGENSFPIEFPVGQLSRKLIERQQQIEALRRGSCEVTGQGYVIEWKTVNTRDLGKQTSPVRIVVPDRDAYLALIHKRREFDAFERDVALIRHRLPALEGWMAQYPQDVIGYHGQCEDLLNVCEYFCQHPRPNIYIRELPIPVHTKFIEQNARILRGLLDELLPGEVVDADETAFTARFGLRDKPALVRMRLLDGQLARHYAMAVDDLSLPVDQCARLLSEHLRPRTVIIVENLINFLTLPRFPDSVGILGGGLAVNLLRDVVWLSQCHVIYWGDIDAHGFEILSDVRSMFPNVRSVMMDQATLDDNADYVVSGSEARTARFDALTDTENRLAQDMNARCLRLEQEHIPHSYAVVRLQQAVLDLA